MTFLFKSRLSALQIGLVFLSRRYSSFKKIDCNCKITGLAHAAASASINSHVLCQSNLERGKDPFCCFLFQWKEPLNQVSDEILNEREDTREEVSVHPKMGQSYTEGMHTAGAWINPELKKNFLKIKQEKFFFTEILRINVKSFNFFLIYDSAFFFSPIFNFSLTALNVKQNFICL